ncbi:MAG: hypothetical protein WBE92_04430 [Steroidobacteraceae bacterium]
MDLRQIQARDAIQSVPDIMMKRPVHLHQRLLYVLDVGSGELQDLEHSNPADTRRLHRNRRDAHLLVIGKQVEPLDFHRALLR